MLWDVPTGDIPSRALGCSPRSPARPCKLSLHSPTNPSSQSSQYRDSRPGRHPETGRNFSLNLFFQAQKTCRRIGAEVDQNEGLKLIGAGLTPPLPLKSRFLDQPGGRDFGMARTRRIMGYRPVGIF